MASCRAIFTLTLTFTLGGHSKQVSVRTGTSHVTSSEQTACVRGGPLCHRHGFQKNTNNGRHLHPHVLPASSSSSHAKETVISRDNEIDGFSAFLPSSLRHGFNSPTFSSAKGFSSLVSSRFSVNFLQRCFSQLRFSSLSVGLSSSFLQFRLAWTDG